MILKDLLLLAQFLYTFVKLLFVPNFCDIVLLEVKCFVSFCFVENFLSVVTFLHTGLHTIQSHSE